MVCLSKFNACCSTLLTLGVIIAATSTINMNAQVAGGNISGTISDATGRVIPEVHISITNPDTGINRTLTTNSDGLYTAPNLLPGTYDLTFTASGFRTEVRSAISITVGAAQVIDVTLQIGKAVETVQVQSEAPAVQVSTSDISAVV